MPRKIDSVESREKYNNYMRDYRKKNKVSCSWKRITVSLSDYEYKKLKALARTEKKNLSACFRTLAMSKFIEDENYPSDVKARFIEFVQIMRGIGNNINQIARHSNQFKTFILDRELHEQFKSLENQTQKFLSSDHKYYDYKVHE